MPTRRAPPAWAAARRLALAAAAVALAAGYALPATAATYRAPRTSFGQPDLQGVWTNTSVTMLQRPPGLKSLVITEKEAQAVEGQFARFLESAGASSAPADPNAPAPAVTGQVANSEWAEMEMKMARIGGEIRSSWIVEPLDGRLPFTDAGRAAARSAQRDKGYADPEARPADERCLTGIGAPQGPPMMNAGYNGHYEIVQTPDHVAILVEMNHDVRIVPLRVRAHAPQVVRPWMGDSVGWWEGDTLVVETTNFSAERGYVAAMGGGFALSPFARVVERFTRTARDRILYTFVVEDPVNFTQPWKAEMPLRAASGPIFEYACHEGNYSLSNILAGARHEEKAP